MNLLSTVVSLAAIAAFAEGATRVQVCKAPNKADCIPVDVNFVQCVNLHSEGIEIPPT
jgi:hypothetical protein